ncbi:N6-adenosine-methyltransferase TMT1A-like [Hydractinia symbiolongicarpus]|uniref:N6-adenosine-methyltransferase TMT1A-like n=1 Tax=Hydractinia symbiolongicarpus TaxID=13093 RepID=UPI00254E2657|nr:N6-adenosine-methyltransferase TMT1A-like [Hydractinia symbiolongicarpus]
MSNVILSGLTTITTISVFDGWDNIADILSDIRKIGCWFHRSLPDNKFVKVAVYGFGSLVVLRSLPFVLRRSSFFSYCEKEMIYFHRSNSNPDVIRYKEELLKELKDEEHGLPLLEDEKLVILELNAGGGTNLSYYPKGAYYIATDIHEECKEQLENNFFLDSDEENIKLNRFINTIPEELNSVPDNSVSCVVSFHALCSARGTFRALEEIKRVLMPGGKLYFIEHTAVTERWTAMWVAQINFRPSMFLVGCCIKNIGSYIENVGFSEVNYKNTWVDMSKLIGPLRSLAPHVYGYAVK